MTFPLAVDLPTCLCQIYGVRKRERKSIKAQETSGRLTSNNTAILGQGHSLQWLCNKNQHYILLRKENGTNKLKFRMSGLFLNEIDLQENMLVARLSRFYFANNRVIAQEEQEEWSETSIL